MEVNLSVAVAEDPPEVEEEAEVTAEEEVSEESGPEREGDARTEAEGAEPLDVVEDEPQEAVEDEPQVAPPGEEHEEASEEMQGTWRDPTSWLEPSIETLREEYERNREASLLETGEVVPTAEEVASEGLPFEVSVQKDEDTQQEDPPDIEEGRVEEITESAAAFEVPENCAWCREKLPDRPGVNFCPFCGMSVKLVPCPECGEELELNWRFCIACGTEVSS